MVKLTPDFVSRAPSRINPLKERELELRGLAIQTIENLGAFQGGYDALNLSDNALTTIANLPLSTRLRSILLANNSISSIASSISTNVPNLTTLTLSGNSITSLASLLPLESCTNLRYLNLQGNPVKNESHYREFCIWKVAGGRLHVLDFNRIKDAERTNAIDLFLTAPPNSQPNALAVALCTPTSSAAAGAKQSVGTENGHGGPNKGRLMSDEEREKVKKAIAGAQSVLEVRRLEKMLAEGHMPEEEEKKTKKNGAVAKEGEKESGDVEAEKQAKSGEEEEEEEEDVKEE